MVVPAVTLDEQVECVRRELKFRERVYPRLIGSGKMTASLAARELERMSAVLSTLVGLSNGGRPAGNDSGR